jgi:hypothetical protein
MSCSGSICSGKCSIMSKPPCLFIVGFHGKSVRCTPLQYKPLLHASQEQERLNQKIEGKLQFAIIADDRYARSRAFPPQAVLGPCFSTGWRSSVVYRIVTPVHGRPAGQAKRRPVNGPDCSERPPPLEPDVNVGPNTAFGGKGRERPYEAAVAHPKHTRRRGMHLP